MNIISFAWTTPALLAFVKTCTRRDWDEDYAKRFHKGDLLAAYDHSPRIHGHQIGVIELVDDPHRQRSDLIPLSDWVAEGFQYLADHGLTLHGLTPLRIWNEWHDNPRRLWVVRFKLVSVTEG
jgi:hypothetical protein